MRLSSLRLLLGVALLMVVAVPVAALQSAPVTAEAIGEANLRANASVESDQVGRIVAGTRYAVVGRSEFLPWLLLGDPTTQAPIGWVFRDLVNVQGDLGTVPFSTMLVLPGAALPTAAPPAGAASSPSSAPPAPNAAVPTPSPTPTPPSGITGRARGEINVRYGPGVDYPRIGVAQAGDTFELTGYHTQLPWVMVRYPAVQGGFGWIALDLLEISGNVFSLTPISQTTFALPTLTPTPPVVRASTRAPADVLSPEFAALGDTLWEMLLSGGFDPATSRLGALFLMDLQTGEALTFGETIAFSGISLSKIPILVTLYRYLDAAPDGALAFQMGNMMVCSENTSSNNVLTLLGDTPYEGANRVTDTMRQLGLNGTFLAAPFLIDPRITPQPVAAPVTDLDQASARPDPFNQTSVEDLGLLLAAVYQCAADGSGPLTTVFGGAITPTECAQLLYLMTQNEIGALIEVGVPDDVPVANKHGWVDETHGDAGIVFSPGGDYVLVVVLRAPVWLNFEESFPLIEQISLTVYNHYNPDAPMPAVRQSNVPATCDLLSTGVVETLQQGGAGALFPRVFSQP